MAQASEKLPGFGLLLRELARCGWTPSTGGRLTGELIFQAGQGGARTPSIVMENQREERLLLIDFGDRHMNGREEFFPRFLDFSIETRLALGAARLVASATYLLLMSAGQIELYRLPGEILEYRATDLPAFEDELLPALAAKAHARGDGLASAANPMEIAQTLRGWLSHWGRQLAASLEVDLKDCECFLWKLVLMLQAQRKTARSELLGGWGLTCEASGDTWSLAYDSLSTLEDLSRQLETFEQTFSSRVFSGDAEMHQGWLARLEETSLVERLRAELLMQSRMKFEAETAAWLWTDMDLEQAGWRRDVAGAPPLRKRMAHDGWMVISPLACDVGRFGLTAALRDAGRLAAFWSEQDVFARSAMAARAEKAFTQPDLFFATPRGIGPSNQLDDGVNFIFSEALRLHGVPEKVEFGVTVAFLLEALTWVERHDWPFFGIDTVDKLMARE